MAHILTVVLSTSLALVIVVSAPVHFAETEYIDVVTDKIQDLESSLFEMLGTNPLSVHFAEFALRYGKRYGSVRQLVHSLSTFVKNAELIESRNYITLPYTVVMNGNFLYFFFFAVRNKNDLLVIPALYGFWCSVFGLFLLYLKKIHSSVYTCCYMCIYVVICVYRIVQFHQPSRSGSLDSPQESLVNIRPSGLSHFFTASARDRAQISP
jgi:hypothetical protein